ncbi:hypothetical protein RIF29_00813 [Crotalaria pallida]|uniref:Uncharacterized protein n=1 Tax=Crotalaria pallida TaxID=3830 RepID=A0AAN9IW23_CROPI
MRKGCEAANLNDALLLVSVGHGQDASCSCCMIFFRSSSDPPRACNATSVGQGSTILLLKMEVRAGLNLLVSTGEK